MKKFFGIFAAVFALTAIVFSCQKAEMDEPKAEQTYDKVETVLTAVLEPRTKVALAFPNLSWEDQDQIAVFDGVDPKPNVFTCSIPAAEEGDEAVETEPTFSGSISGQAAATLYAVYPYNENASLSEGKITTVIPHEQVIPEGGNVDKSALLCVASTSTNELNFRNVLGLVKVTVPSGMTGITSISVKGADEADVLAGTGAVAVSDAPSFVATDAKNMVTLTHAKGGFPKGDYYIAVAPVKFANGFSVSFTKANGETQTKSTENANEVLRNSGLNVGDQLTDITWSYIITTKDQLVEWNNNYKSWTKNDIVELGADIDLDGVDWTPHDFSGRFDGDNHKIYNISISRDGYCGFVAALNGTIQNLYLGTSDGEAYDGKSEYVYTPDATAGSWVHMGGVAASINNGALIKNVTNFVKISTPDSDGQAKVCMGGLVSMGTGTGEIQDCVNYGDIVCDASVGMVSNASNHQIGGIMCKTDGTVTITNCKNYGNISAKGAYVDNVGGIMANPNGNSTNKEVKTRIKGCYNYGNITITKTTSEKSPMALGGIVGKLTGATVEDCHNEGNISSVCDVLTGIGGVVGIHKLDFESTVTGCSNGVQNAADKGILSFNPVDGTQQMVIGGILGYSEDYKGKLRIISCTNYAPISTSYNVMRNIGGIVGAVGKVTNADGEKSSVELLIDKCHNYGAVTIGGTNSFSQRHIGGIAGMLYGSDEGVVVSDCTNNAVIQSSATNGGEHRISGIAGHVRYGKITISSCTNNGEVKTTGTAKNPRPAGIVGVAFGNESGSVLEISGCYNRGKISNTSTVNGNVQSGGIVGYLRKGNITGCYNEATVEVTKAGNNVMLGGIVGSDNTAASTITDCVNRGQVLFSVANKTGYVGGILGQTAVAGTSIINCTNEMANAEWEYSVKSISQNSINVGGILGRTDGKTVTVSGCTNGGIIIGENPANNTNTYVGVGGICGRINNSSAAVKNNVCTSSSHVKAIANNTNQLVVAGGIIGGAHTVGKISGNVNNGKVTATNAATASNNCAYAGGIFGSDCEGGSGAASVTGNKNYGAVHAAVTGMAATDNTSYFSGTGTGIGAGGLFGGLSKTAAANVAADNINYGNVTASDFGTASGAGALAGVSEITWSGLVGKTVTVNGVAGAAAAPEASWVCPSGNVTATYVDAIQ